MKTFEEYSFERANQDYIVSNTFLRSAVQVALLINGGAATASLAVVSRLTKPTLAHPIAYALAGYAIGVFFAALMMMVMTFGLECWADAWERRATTSKEPYSSLKPAARWYWYAKAFFLLSMLAFVCGSAVAVWGFATLV